MLKAFNTFFANVMSEERLMFDGKRAVPFYCEDHVEAKKVVHELALAIGFKLIDTSFLNNACHVEAILI